MIENLETLTQLQVRFSVPFTNLSSLQFVKKKECKDCDEKDGEEEDGESRKEWEGDEVMETMGRIERRRE